MPATVWKGSISFGLVSFPVRLHAAARVERVGFHMLHKKDLSRVKEVWYCAEENKPIDRSDIVKGYETTKGHWVVVEDEELKKIAPATATTMDVVKFVAEDEVDPIHFEHSYYVAPEGAGAKPYSLFLTALTETKQHALAQVAMHNREHVVLMRPSEDGLVLHTLFYPEELHKANKGTHGKTKYTATELELAKKLIAHLKGTFREGEFEDHYRENVLKMIAQKKKGQKVTPIAAPAKKAPATDIIEALKKSLAERGHTAKKPARGKKAA